RPAHAATRPGPELGLHLPVPVEVADTAQWPALRADAETLQVFDGVRHHSLATSLVEHPAPALDDDDLEARPRPVQSRGQARRSTPADEQVDHVRLASAMF